MNDLDVNKNRRDDSTDEWPEPLDLRDVEIEADTAAAEQGQGAKQEGGDKREDNLFDRLMEPFDPAEEEDREQRRRRQKRRRKGSLRKP